MFRMGPVHARTTVQEYPILSRNAPLGTKTYYMPEGLSIRPNRNRVSSFPTGIYPSDYSTPGRQAGDRGASAPLGSACWPPGRIQQELVAQHMYGHHKHRSYIDTHQFPLSQCKLFKYNRVANNKVHMVFTKVQYPWLSYYGGQQEYNIRSNVRSFPISGVQVYRSTGVQEYQISDNNIIIMPRPRKSDSHEYAI